MVTAAGTDSHMVGTKYWVLLICLYVTLSVTPHRQMTTLCSLDLLQVSSHSVVFPDPCCTSRLVLSFSSVSIYLRKPPEKSVVII